MSPRRFHSSQRHRRQRGSLLIVAMLLAAVIGISLVSYLKLTLTSLTLADRSYYGNSEMNLAEIGLEEAMFCYNQLDNVASPTAAWATVTGGPTWAIAGDNSVTTTLTLPAPGPGVSGVVKVYCSSYNPGSGVTPFVVAKSILTPARGAAISRYIKVTLSRRSLFANGLVSKNSISWVGHPLADSWNSAATSPASPYSAGVQRAGITLGAANGNISLGSGGNVYGYAKTSASGSTSGGSVHGLGTTTTDSTRITADFMANFPAISLPTPDVSYLITSGSVPTDLPRTTDAPASDNKYYYIFGLGAAITATTTIGTAVPNKSVVVIMNNHAGSTAIGFTGSKSLTIKTGSSLTVYTNGDIDTHGNGMVNGTTAGANQASSLIIYGTNPTPGGQSITIGGNGQLYAAIYAPTATVTLQGGGSSGMVLGSVVADSISMNGGTNFHYDEALANLSGGNPFGLVEWRELQTADERNGFSSQLTF